MHRAAVERIRLSQSRPDTYKTVKATYKTGKVHIRQSRPHIRQSRHISDSQGHI